MKMAKRTATTELTDRNWDHEDEPEEAGEFVQASTQIIKQRQIIKAKRKNTSVEGGSKSFTGFSGFSFKPTSTSTPFSFNVKSVTNGQSENKETPASVVPAKASPESSPVKPTPASNGSSKAEGSGNDSCKTYSENLRKLNESVLSWIQKHVEKNAYCILTPIFKDYEKHLDELEKEKSESLAKGNGMEMKMTTTSSTVTEGTNSAISSSKPAFSFGTSATATSGSGFSFGSTGTTAPPDGNKGTNGSSTFGTASATGSGFPGFNLKSNLGSTPSPFFAVGQSSGATGSSKDTEEEEYEPPKPESTEVKEEGALHTVKCKLFYQKDGAWTERGIGFLHLKKPDDKAQLVIRADTTLGNIILNINLSSSLPLNRQGKNNVSLMCVPNPPINTKEDPKATAMLIRVKTAEDADTLYEKMKELRN
ncbi:nuclear pore complex protein Nup50-like isoform X2 [Pecten maximus]|uniref:nuclear pore complex protein Nup50-like isoform X2 n=1 Tax=Pecten maximus TaxID=6579 RepID=UPI001459066B|nr:nuclear pore complex protein Nup50-like isoform X2 [Pecten maximus]